MLSLQLTVTNDPKTNMEPTQPTKLDWLPHRM